MYHQNLAKVFFDYRYEEAMKASKNHIVGANDMVCSPHPHEKMEAHATPSPSRFAMIGYSPRIEGIDDTASCLLLSKTLAYICVVDRKRCPRSLLTVYMSVPRSSIIVAKVWRAQ